LARIHTDEYVQFRFRIPPDSSYWTARLEAACTFLESHPSLPRTSLRYGLKNTDNTRFELDGRSAFFERALRSHSRKFCVVNGRRRTVQGLELKDEGEVIVRSTNPQPPNSFGLLIQVPTIPGSVRRELLVGLGDALDAFSGFHISQRGWWLLHTRADSALRKRSGGAEPEVLRNFRELLERENIDLPVLETNHPMFENPLQPELAGWINYWSEQTAKFLGFSSSAQDQSLFVATSRTATGAWLTEVTREQLDLMDPLHLKIYAKLHFRFPRLGVRQQGLRDR
jgi:Family of unknown function (DUF5953)